MCNLYLQDRQPHRTPRRRGITLVHEMAARGIPVSFASDNTRDPFYAYGDLDMLEVLRQATRIGHLDHTSDDWIRSVITTPAERLRLRRRRRWRRARRRPRHLSRPHLDGALRAAAVRPYRAAGWPRHRPHPCRTTPSSTT